MKRNTPFVRRRRNEWNCIENCNQIMNNMSIDIWIRQQYVCAKNWYRCWLTYEMNNSGIKKMLNKSWKNHAMSCLRALHLLPLLWWCLKTWYYDGSNYKQRVVTIKLHWIHNCINTWNVEFQIFNETCESQDRQRILVNSHFPHLLFIAVNVQ